MSFFKGEIIDLKESSKPDYIYINIIKTKNDEYYYMIGPNGEYHRDDEYSKTLLETLTNIIGRKADEKSIKATEQLCIDIYKIHHCLEGQPIIYERCYDANGNTYANELKASSTFPTITTKNIDYEVFFREEKMLKKYLDKETEKVYFLGDSKQHLINVSNKHDYLSISSIEGFDLYKKTPNDEGYFLNVDGTLHDIIACFPTSFKVTITPKFIFKDYPRVEYAVIEKQIANSKEEIEYSQRFRKGMFQEYRLGKYKKGIKDKALCNCLGEVSISYFKPTKKNKFTEDDITIEIQNLDLSLAKVRSISKSSYEKLAQERDDILNNSKLKIDNNPGIIKEIKALRDKAELAYKCHGEDSKSIYNNLILEVTKCLNNIKNGCKTDSLSVEDLDLIIEQILSNKSNYTAIEQTEILRNIAILYFFALYDKKDLLTEEDFSDSYIYGNIKRIITVITILKEVGIIDKVPNNLYRIVDVSELMELIRNIKLKEKENINEDVNELVKVLQR